MTFFSAVPTSCPSGVYSDGVCCDSNCVAGCTGQTAQQCTACRDVRQSIGNDIPTCTQRCSAGTYEVQVSSYSACLIIVFSICA